MASLGPTREKKGKFDARLRGSRVLAGEKRDLKRASERQIGHGP